MCDCKKSGVGRENECECRGACDCHRPAEERVGYRSGDSDKTFSTLPRR